MIHHKYLIHHADKYLSFIFSDIIAIKMNNNNSYSPSDLMMIKYYTEIASLKSELESALYTNSLLTKNSITVN